MKHITVKVKFALPAAAQLPLLPRKEELDWPCIRSNAVIDGLRAAIIEIGWKVLNGQVPFHT